MIILKMIGLCFLSFLSHFFFAAMVSQADKETPNNDEDALVGQLVTMLFTLISWTVHTAIVFSLL